VPGNGGALNSVASLIAADLLGVSLSQIVAGLEEYRGDGQHLSVTPLALPGGGTATLIDDSYNAEYLSMLNAFAVAAQRARTHGGRIIALLGRIVNLGDQSQAIHRSLATPLLEAGCQHAFCTAKRWRPYMRCCRKRRGEVIFSRRRRWLTPPPRRCAPAISCW
jgi:UDP-N-acetylmuramyl pentapeptide synthase